LADWFRASLFRPARPGVLRGRGGGLGLLEGDCGAPFRGMDSAERPELTFLRFAQRRLVGSPRARVISPSEERQDGKRDRNDERNHAPGYHDARAVANRISAALRREIDASRASGSAL